MKTSDKLYQLADQLKENSATKLGVNQELIRGLGDEVKELEEEAEEETPYADIPFDCDYP